MGSLNLRELAPNFILTIDRVLCFGARGEVSGVGGGDRALSLACNTNESIM